MKLFSLALVAGLAAGASAQAVRIMLLGDSITEISCWRPLVWNQLTTAGLASSVDLVGTMNNLQASCSRPAGFDPDHEGHSGWQAYDIARNNIAGWVQNTRPDIVQFMLGTNDLALGGRTVQQVVDSYTMMLTAMRAANPNVKVIIDKLIPLSFNQAGVDSLNNAIPTWAQQHTTAASPIVVADCSLQNGYSTSWNSDGVHPNAQGDQFIAAQVGPLLIQFIRDVQGGTGPAPPPGTTLTSTTRLPTTTTPPVPAPTTAPPPANCAGLWGQCGGQGWSGPTCCSSGTCRAQNQWYSQCLN